MKAILILCIALSVQYLSEAVEVRSPPFIYKYYPRYCDLKSCQNQHTMCTYRPLVLRCQAPCKAFMYKYLRRLILNNHNEGRLKAASDAVNMMKLRWNNDLEHMAHQWVGLCYNRTEKCLRTRFDEEFGQVVHAWYVDSEGYNSTVEIDSYTKGLYEKNDAFFQSLHDSVIGKWDGEDYDKIQLIWAETRFIGCSYLEEPMGNKTIARMVCNYFPPTKMGQPIFVIDDGTTQKCPNGTKSSKRYATLCTDEMDEYDDIPPPWYTRVRVYNGRIIYPEAPDAAALPKFRNILFALMAIINQL